LRAIWWQNLELGLLLPMCISSLLGADYSHRGGAFLGGFCNLLFSSESDDYRHKIELVVWMNCAVLAFLRLFFCV
jgi:hypothetical protein